MSCECSKPILIFGGGSGGGAAATLYTTSATLLGDRVVNANNHDLTFNMGTGDYIINGLLSTTGIDLAQITTNPGDATTLWVSGAQQQLILGDYNISRKVSNDAGNLITVGSDSAAYFSPSLLCFALANCSIDALQDVQLLGVASSGKVLTWSDTYGGFIPETPFTYFTVSDGSNTQQIHATNTLLFSPSGRMKISVQATDIVNFKYDEILTRLLYDSGTNILTYIDESGNATNLILNSAAFACSNLNSCSINSLGDVNTTGSVNGQVLAFNGSSWQPTTITVSGGGSFTCLSLSGCSASALLDITYPSPPASGQSLIWSSGDNAWIPYNPLWLSISDTGGTTLDLSSKNRIILFGGDANTTVDVSLGPFAGGIQYEYISISHTDVLTSLSYNAGTSTITYTDELGVETDLVLSLSGGGSAFVCSALNSCSISALSDVQLFGTPSDGDSLIWSNIYSAFISQQPYQYFSISDGTNTQQINSTNTITFSGAGNLNTLVQGTDTVVLSYIENLTTLSFDSGTNTLSYLNESGNTTNLILNSFNCSDLNSCSINSMSDVNTAGAVNGQVLAYNGSSWQPTTITVSGGGSFTCLSLSGCSASSLQDITYPSAPSGGQTLTWSSGNNAWIPETPFTSFSISDLFSTTLDVHKNDRIVFFGSGSGPRGTTVDVQTGPFLGGIQYHYISVNHQDVLTSLTYVSGTNTLTYTDENGNANNIVLLTGTGGGGGVSFSCASLESCSINSLVDVNTSLSTVNSGDTLVWSNVYSAFIAQQPYQYFSITDGVNTQTIQSTNTITFSGVGSLHTNVQGTDTVVLSYAEHLTALSFDSGTNQLSYLNESGNTTTLTLNEFNCSDLNSCSIDAMSDVSTAGATNGQVLAYNGAAWTPTTITVSGGGSFTCLSLSGCSASALLDIIYPSGPGDGQALIWSSGSNAWIPQNVYSGFTITDGSTSQTISSGNTLTFTGVGRTSATVQATDTVVIRHTDVLTSLSFDSGTNVLSYLNESGSTTNLILNSFNCSDLNSCSINSLSDVVLFGTPTQGQALTWSNTYSAFIPQATFTSFTVSDGTNTQSINDGNTLQVLGTGRLRSTVSATDTVTLSYTDILTTLTYNSGTNTLTYTNESGTVSNLLLKSFSCSDLNACSIDALSDVNTTGATNGQVLAYNGASWQPTTITVSGGGSFTCLSLSGCSASALLDIIYPSGPGEGQALVWSSGSNAWIPQDIFTSFSVTDGTNSQTITNGNSLRFSGGGDIAVTVSATDRVAISFTETTTTLTYSSGLNRLTYTDENGSVTNINLLTSTGGGGSFSCSSLNSCSIDAMSDVNTGGATSGKYLKYNGSQWVHSDLAVSTNGGNDLTLGSDGYPYFAETLTSLTSVSGSYLKYRDENNNNTDINICGLIGSCSINSLSDVTITGATTNQILRWNGSQWINSTESTGGYSFTISDGTTSQTINSGNTLTFADSTCINATVSATDTVSFAPIIAPAQDITGAGVGVETFSNALQCTAQGLFVPCVEAYEPTPTRPDRFILRIPCGNDWQEFDLPWYDNIKRVPGDAAITDGDPASTGVDLYIDGNTGEFFYQDAAATYRKARGTYGYANNSIAFTAGVAQNINHNLGTNNVIVQMYLGGIVKYDCTIQDIGLDYQIRITTPSSASYKVCILPVYDL